MPSSFRPVAILTGAAGGIGAATAAALSHDGFALVLNDRDEAGLRHVSAAFDAVVLAVFLVSPRAAYLTGAVVPVTGAIELLPPVSDMAGGAR
jgi:NADP-dependent 3-hydroxy acid dehydrogenase YdfG